MKRRHFLWATLLATTPTIHASEVTDLVVVGAGCAGLCAALAAVEGGLSVTLIDKSDGFNGTSARAEGLFNVVDPLLQFEMQIEDSPEKFTEQTFDFGQRRADKHLTRQFCYRSLEIMRWLQMQGVHFSNAIEKVPMGLYPRTKRISGGGVGLVRQLHETSQRKGVRFLSHTMMTSLVWDAKTSRVVGIRDNHKVLLARAGVILAAGGFGANREMVSLAMPSLNDQILSVSANATGEVILAAQDIGAATLLMDAVQLQSYLMPSNVPLTHTVASQVAVNRSGSRFTREDVTSREFSQRTANQLGSECWLLGADSLSQQSQLVDVQKAAEKIGCPATALKRTLSRYSDFVRSGDQDFHKSPLFLKRIDLGKLYIDHVKQKIHSTPGGLQINRQAQVISRRGTPIEGLFAAGEITGATHGLQEAKGNGLLSAAVFGKIAAESAIRKRG